MADGAYYLRIVASDAPSNPSGEALEGQPESDRFMVDNMPPSLEKLAAAAPDSSGAAHVRFTARDSASAIARAEFSIDAGDWTLVYPVGRLSDSLEEHYDIALKALAPGEHTIAVRVYDRFENMTAGKGNVPRSLAGPLTSDDRRRAPELERYPRGARAHRAAHPPDSGLHMRFADEIAGAKLFFKCENLQNRLIQNPGRDETRSFCCRTPKPRMRGHAIIRKSRRGAFSRGAQPRDQLMSSCRITRRW